MKNETQTTETENELLLSRGIATAQELGNGLFRIIDSEVLLALPCQPLRENQTFRSLHQPSQDHCKCK